MLLGNKMPEHWIVAIDSHIKHRISELESDKKKCVEKKSSNKERRKLVS